MADEKQEKTEEGAGGSGSSKLLLIITAVNVLLTLGVVGVLLVSFKKETKPTAEDISAEATEPEKDPAQAAAAKKETQFGTIIRLNEFTVNLATEGTLTPKFAKARISLEVPSADTENEVQQKMPQVRNAIIDLFNSKRASDLATADGRNYLKEEIQGTLNNFLVTGKVSGVFFTNFALGG